MTAAAWSIIARISPANSLGNRSAIQTSRQRRAPSARTCTDALWCVSRPPRADQASRRASSSTSTISSRTTMPLPNVTTRAPSSRRVSTTNPGTRRVQRADVANRGPDVLGAALEQDFLADAGHDDLLPSEVILSGARRAGLGESCDRPGSPAEAPGRDSGGAVEGAHEVRDVAEAD